MGCWNETCFVSKLPIHYDEDIVMILCVDTPFADGQVHTCYPCDSYKPFGYPIYGKYDDYGGIKDIKNAEKVLKYLEIFAFSRVDDDDEYEVTAGNLNEFLNLVSEQKIKCSFYSKPITPMLIKRPLYDKLINHVKNRKMYSGETYKTEFTNTVMSELRKIKPRVVKADEDTLGYELYHATDIHAAQLSHRDSGHEITNYLLTRILRKLVDGKTGSRELNDLLEIMCLKTAFQLLRIGYFCTSGAGSQSDEMLIHKLVAKFVIDECKRKIDEYRAEDDTTLSDDELLSETLYHC